MYATLGGQWSYGERITYSLVPDGTSIGGTPSTLFQTMGALFPNDATWQLQFQKAAAVWQQVADVNLVWIQDDGRAMGTGGYQQGDPGIGDIRISAIPLADGTLGAALSPPPINGGSAAGDIVMSSSIAWRINSGFDLETVAIHEFGHALGMSHSQITNAVMYAYYNGIKQNTTSDDASGIQSLYGPRQYDALNSGGKNNGNYYQPTVLSLNANSQVTIGNLDITRYGQSEWFYVTAPASTTGNLTVVAQASGLSLLTPQLNIYNASTYATIFQSTNTGYGSTAWVANLPTSAGKSYLIQVSGNTAGSMYGGFAFQVNFGSTPLPPVPIPYSAVAAQSYGSGALSTMQSALSSASKEQVQLGGLVGWGDDLTIQGFGLGHDQPPVGSSSASLPWETSMRFAAGPVSNPASPIVPSHAPILVAAERSTRSMTRGADRATVAWARQAAPSTILVGRSKPWIRSTA